MKINIEIEIPPEEIAQIQKELMKNNSENIQKLFENFIKTMTDPKNFYSR